MGNTWRKLLALTLSVSMITGMFTVGALATGEEEGETARPAYCGQEAHTHSIENGCYGMICGQEEGEGAVEGHTCEHTTHDETCGYMEAQEEVPCNHSEHDTACGYVEAKAEVPCECADTDEDGVIEHVEGCSYEPAVEGYACKHAEGEHDESCGYKPAVEGHTCKHENGEHDDTCGYVEAVEGHHHTDACYDTTATICEFTEEHTHTEACYFEAAFDFETGTLTVNGSGELTWEIMDSFRFTDETGKSWMLNIPEVNKLGENGTAAGVLNDEVKKVVIGDGITAIGEKALGGSGSTHGSSTISRSLLYVEELVLPEGLLTIGKSAFSSMGQRSASDLFTVNFPSSLERIGEQAFSQCKKLPKELTIAAPNVVIEGSVFWGCTSIETLIIDGAKEIKDYAFESGGFSSDLKSVTMKNVGTVNRNVFSGQTKLTDLTMTNVDEIAKLAFWGVSSLETVTLTNVKKIGDQAFYGWYSYDSKYMNLKNLTIDGCDSIGYQAFVYCNNLADVSLNHVTMIGQQAFQQAFNQDTQLEMDNIGTIGQNAFFYSYMNAVKMGKVGTISQYAFSSCAGLTAIDSLKDVGRIDGFAFYGCSNLSGLTVEDLTKMGFNGNYGDVMERVQAILRGEFKLDAAPGIVDITVGIPEEGWEDGKTAQSGNWNTYDNGTQLTEQARWTNEDKTEAEVKVDAYYTAPRQMDYVFVADLSASMAQLGNAADMNSRFYDMQSKLLDMTNELLNAGEVYDCRVAIVTFGGALDADNPGTSTVMEFTDDAETAMAHINSLEPLYENTDYGLGLPKVQELAESNTDRNTVVVFLSDGAPYLPDGVTGSDDKTGVNAAAAIKALNVPIYGVLHSPGAGHDTALKAMKAVCSAPTAEVPVTVFEATDTESFGKAMNDAFTAIYPDYTVTIPVNEDFENVRDLAVSVSGGEAAYDDASHTITWTITGMPFTKHTLTYNMSLTRENADRYGDQSYDVNNGNAVITDGASVETPVLTRTRNRPTTPTDPSTSYYTLTIHYVYADGATASATVTRSRLERGDRYSVTSPVIEGYTADTLVVEGTMPGQNVEVTVTYTADEDIDEPDTPLTETPDTDPEEEDLTDPDTPLSENPDTDPAGEEELKDEEPPLAEAPQTGDDLTLWLALTLLSAMGLCWIALTEKKGKRTIR